MKKTAIKKTVFFFFLLGAFTFSVQAQDSNQKSLFEAIRDNNTQLIESIHKINPALIDSSFYQKAFLSGVTKYPIHEALRYSDKKTIDYLIKLGADPLRSYYTSAIMRGSYKSSLEILVEYRDLDLIKYFINKIKPDAKSYTLALLWAAENKKNDKVKYLLSVGESILLSEE